MSNWSEENVLLLKKYWGSSTAREIAEKMGSGFTRNSIIGKASRLGLSAKIKTRSASTNKNNVKSNEQENKFKKRGRGNKFRSLIIENDFEPENPKQLEELDESVCKWPMGHPNESSFYFCGRKSLKDFSYCKLHLLYAFQPKSKKEDVGEKEEDIPQFIEKKIKSA